MKIISTGYLEGTGKNKDGTTYQVTMKDVGYVEGLQVNLVSLNHAIIGGMRLVNDAEVITLTFLKGTTLHFDIILEGSGVFANGFTLTQ